MIPRIIHLESTHYIVVACLCKPFNLIHTSCMNHILDKNLLEWFLGSSDRQRRRHVHWNSNWLLNHNQWINMISDVHRLDLVWRVACYAVRALIITCTQAASSVYVVLHSWKFTRMFESYTCIHRNFYVSERKKRMRHEHVRTFNTDFHLHYLFRCNVLNARTDHIPRVEFQCL